MSILLKKHLTNKICFFRTKFDFSSAPKFFDFVLGTGAHEWFERQDGFYAVEEKFKIHSFQRCFVHNLTSKFSSFEIIKTFRIRLPDFDPRTSAPAGESQRRQPRRGPCSVCKMVHEELCVACISANHNP